MKKLTLILSLLVAMVTTAMAQETITISASQNLTQQWTSNGKTDGEGTYAPWGTDVIADYPTGITPSSGNEVHMATTNVTIEELGRLKFTFQYSSGDHRLNILGVDLLNAESEVVAHDYHNGQTGSGSTNNIYTFFVPASGTYTLRYFVEHNTGGNDLRRTNGTITGKITESKTILLNYISSFTNIGLWSAEEMSYIKEITQAVEDENINTEDKFNTFITSYKELFHNIINDRCFTFNSKGRETTNGRYLGVSGTCVDGTINVVATDANELKNIWKLEYIENTDKYRVKNVAYDVYIKPTSSYGENKTIQTTSSQNDAGQFFIVPQDDKISLGDRTDISARYFLHETNWTGHEIVRWTADENASKWTATLVPNESIPELCSITYNYTLNGVNFRTENLSVEKGTEYTFVKNYTEKAGMRLTTEIPAAEVINENKVVTYEYEKSLPFEPATVTSENRLAQGSKLYKITLRYKSTNASVPPKKVSLKADGTEFEFNNNNAAIENQLFAFVGDPVNDWQIFNYAAGLDKPIWAADNNSDTKFVPTAGITDKLEVVMHNNEWSFKKKGTNAYIHDKSDNFAVWNYSSAHTDGGSHISFTEATEKEICIADLNMDIIKPATHYLALSDDATAKENLQNAINAANTAIADEASTVEQIKEHGETIKQLTEVAIQTLNITTAEGFNNNGVYTFVTSRGWLVYNSENPDVVASTASYTSLAKGNDKAYCQWAMHKSANTGLFYMYNIGANKFVGNPSSGDRIPFVDSPTNDIKILAGTKNSYPIIVATNSTSVINHFSHTGVPGVANWTDGQYYKGDDGSCHVVTKVALIDNDVLANITDLVDVYEARINKPDLLAKIEELTSFKESSFLTEEEKTAITTAIEEADAAYNNEEQQRYSIFAQQINKLNELKKQLQYIWNTEKLSNDLCYAVQTESLGSWIAEDRQDGTRLNSTTKLSTTHDVTNQDQQFAFIKSANTGNYYLYSVGKGKFVKKDSNYTLLTEEPEQTASFLEGTRDNEYPWVIALNINANTQQQLCVSSGYTPGVVTNWNDTADPGNTVRIEIAGTFDSVDALAKIEAYETSSKKEELLEKIGEANEYSAKTYLPQDKRDGLSAAATTAQGVYDNPAATYEEFVEQIAIIEELLNSCLYVTSPEGFSNNAIYTILSKGGSYIMWNETKGEGNYAISSAKFNDITPGEDVPGCQWALYTSTSGKHYLYNIGAGKFMGTTTDNNGSIPMNIEPTSNALIIKNSDNEDYPLMFSVNNGTGSLNHNNYYTYGLLNWNSGWTDTTGDNNIHKVTVVGALEEETLSTIEELVNKFETIGELKTLLDGIYAGYYDAWSSSPNKWRINEGVNNYSQKEGDEDFVTAYNEARAYIDLPLVDTSVEDIETQINRMNGLVANLTINQPQDGKYYRIRCTDGNDGKRKYLSSNTNDAGRMLTTEGKDQSNIFYYTNGGLLSYNRGVYIHAESSSNQVKLRDVAETSTAEFIDGKDNNKPGSYIIYVKNSEAGAGRYIHGLNETTDSGKDKPTNGTYSGYTWWLEEVTELPVNITAAGYASFYAPVAVTIPSEIEAYYLTNIIGEFASMTKIESGIIPANTGVMLTGENGEPAESNTYNFTITDDIDPIEDNMFNGSAAAEYVTGDAYVLANGNNGVGLYLATLNQEGKFKNNSHKAYLLKSVLYPAAQMSAGFRFRFDGGVTTEIEEVESINENVEIYDLTGRKLQGISGAGIYIINGKKVIVR